MESNNVDTAEKILKQSWAEREIDIILKQTLSLGRIGEEKDKIENLLQAMNEDKISPEDAVAAAHEILSEKQMQGSM